MLKQTLVVCLSTLLLSSGNAYSDSSKYEAALNTANTIRAAWELRRLSESLAPGVDTRCYIAKLAAFQAESLPQAAKVIEQYPSGNKNSDTFAIQSTNGTMETYKNNQIQKIANECKSKKGS